MNCFLKKNPFLCDAGVIGDCVCGKDCKGTLLSPNFCCETVTVDEWFPGSCGQQTKNSVLHTTVWDKQQSLIKFKGQRVSKLLPAEQKNSLSKGKWPRQEGF